jgi:hypothetical protein
MLARESEAIKMNTIINLLIPDLLSHSVKTQNRVTIIVTLFWLVLRKLIDVCGA